jgi:hypothetical protein
MVDPIRRQLLFDFERLEEGLGPSVMSEPLLLRRPVESPPGVQEMFLEAVQAEEAGEKIRAIHALPGDDGARSELRAGMDQPGDDSLPSARV